MEEKITYILSNFENMVNKEKKLMYLLKATGKIKNENVQLLRKMIINYINTHELYISHLELENFDMTYFVKSNKRNMLYEIIERQTKYIESVK